MRGEAIKKLFGPPACPVGTPSRRGPFRDYASSPAPKATTSSAGACSLLEISEDRDLVLIGSLLWRETAMLRFSILVTATAALLISGGDAAAQAGRPLGPNGGEMILVGDIRDNDGGQGEFRISATLSGGDFRGALRLTLNGQTIEAPLIPARSYLENGKCYFRAESGRARAELGGPCDTASIRGIFETFIPGEGLSNGTMSGRFQSPSAAAPVAARPGVLPTARLTCAYQDRRIGVGMGEATQYSLAYSNMASLTLDAAGTYRTASGGGRFTRAGDKIRLTTGTWAGAVATLEADRSGEPAVVFHIQENRRANGAHVVDPYTTRCTRAR